MSVLSNFWIICFLFFGHAHSLQALSSPIRDWTRAPCSRRMESRPLDHQEIPAIIFYQSYLEIKSWSNIQQEYPGYGILLSLKIWKNNGLRANYPFISSAPTPLIIVSIKRKMGNLHTFLLTVAVMLSFLSRRCCVLESPFKRKGHFYWAWCASKAGCCSSDSLQQCS